MKKEKFKVGELVKLKGTPNTYFVTRIEGGKYGLSNRRVGEPVYWMAESKLEKIGEEKKEDDNTGKAGESKTEVLGEEGTADGNQ